MSAGIISQTAFQILFYAQLRIFSALRHAALTVPGILPAVVAQVSSPPSASHPPSAKCSFPCQHPRRMSWVKHSDLPKTQSIFKAILNV